MKDIFILVFIDCEGGKYEWLRRKQVCMIQHLLFADDQMLDEVIKKWRLTMVMNRGGGTCSMNVNGV